MSHKDSSNIIKKCTAKLKISLRSRTKGGSKSQFVQYKPRNQSPSNEIKRARTQNRKHVLEQEVPDKFKNRLKAATEKQGSSNSSIRELINGHNRPLLCLFSLAALELELTVQTQTHLHRTYIKPTLEATYPASHHLSLPTRARSCSA